MDESSLLVLVISFILGFVLLKKDKSTTHEDTRKGKGASSLSKARHSVDTSESGVSKYISSKEELNVDEELKESSVAKYLANKEKSSLSGVSKYMAKQILLDEQKAKENVSGVEKYLNNKK